jgi:uncharacterized protein
MVERDMRQAGGVPGVLDVTPDKHRAGTRGADRAVVFGLRAANTGFFVSNDRIAQFVREDPKRLIAFCSADPLADADPVGEVKRCHDELGMRGIKMGPTYQGVAPDHPKMIEIYAYAQKHGLPILLHQGTTFSLQAPLKYANPILLEDIAYRFPELKMIIAHMGHPWIGECVALIRKQPNVYADISALQYRPYQFYQALKLAEEYGAHKKLLFGSDYPLTTVEKTLATMRGMNAYARQYNMPPIADEVINGIIERDALGLLGLG